jgi:hypothetical protein
VSNTCTGSKIINKILLPEKNARKKCQKKTINPNKTLMQNTTQNLIFNRYILLIMLSAISFHCKHPIGSAAKLEIYGIKENSLPLYPRNYKHIIDKHDIYFKSKNQEMIDSLSRLLKSLKVEKNTDAFSCKICFILSGRKGKEIYSIGTNSTVLSSDKQYSYNYKINDLLYRYSTPKDSLKLSAILPSQSRPDRF